MPKSNSKIIKSKFNQNGVSPEEFLAAERARDSHWKGVQTPLTASNHELSAAQNEYQLLSGSTLVSQDSFSPSNKVLEINNRFHMMML
jgi:hypothetical protein